MRAYIEFAKKKFQNQIAYPMEVFMGILNTVLTVVIFCSIYRALYGEKSQVDGITFSMVATNFLISLGLSEVFSFDEMFLQNKYRDGTISNELLKPVNFKFRMLAENIGSSGFKLLFHFMPAVLFTCCYTSICKPKSPESLLLMAVSVMLGYLVLWLLSFIVQTWCFWIFSTWGIMVMKNVVVNILSGTMLPLWFMPDSLRKIVAYTPFQAIYFVPVQIYLGQVEGIVLAKSLLSQLLWIGILYFIGELFWQQGIKRVVVQGG